MFFGKENRSSSRPRRRWSRRSPSAMRSLYATSSSLVGMRYRKYAAAWGSSRTAPVRATGTHQGEPLAISVVRQVRAAAEVLPDGPAGLRVHVVVNGDFTLADLYGCALGSIRTRTGALGQGESSSSLYGSFAISATASSW